MKKIFKCLSPSDSQVKKSKKKKNSEILNQIDDFLFLGNEIAAKNPSVIEANGIKFILQVIQMDPVPELQEKVVYLRLPIRGGRNTDIQPILQESLRFIHAAVSSGQNILVHCKHGKNRSASLVIAYIMAIKSFTVFEAERYVMSKRPIVEIKSQTRSVLTRLGFRGLQHMLA
jgi:hypothetical protein